MKNTGIVRKLDELGRIVIPKETRRSLELKHGDSLEIYIDRDQIILKKYMPGCMFCGEVLGVKSYKGKNICKSCLKNIRRIE